jgi:hypothetical protein
MAQPFLVLLQRSVCRVPVPSGAARSWDTPSAAGAALSRRHPCTDEPRCESHSRGLPLWTPTRRLGLACHRRARLTVRRLPGGCQATGQPLDATI